MAIPIDRCAQLCGSELNKLESHRGHTLLSKSLGHQHWVYTSLGRSCAVASLLLPGLRGEENFRRGFRAPPLAHITDSGPSPIGHGPIELDSNIWIWLQRTPVAVAVVSLAVMCSYGPDKLLLLLGALLVPLNETCSPQTILILPICYCPMCPIQWDRVQLNWTWFFSR